jgi:hypothetical protein
MQKLLPNNTGSTLIVWGFVEVAPIQADLYTAPCQENDDNQNPTMA